MRANIWVHISGTHKLLCMWCLFPVRVRFCLKSVLVDNLCTYVSVLVVSGFGLMRCEVICFSWKKEDADIRDGPLHV